MSSSLRAGRAIDPGSPAATGCRQRTTISRSEDTTVRFPPPMVINAWERTGIVCRRSATPWIPVSTSMSRSLSTVKFIVFLFLS